MGDEQTLIPVGSDITCTFQSNQMYQNTRYVSSFYKNIAFILYMLSAFSISR